MTSCMDTSAIKIESGTPRVHRTQLGTLDVESTEAIQLVREWFRSGVDAFGKHEAFAERRGVSKQNLSDMLAGRRPIYLRDALPFLGETPAAVGFTGWQCNAAGLAQPKLEVTVSLSGPEAKLLSFLRASSVWRLFLGDLIAREFYRCDRELLDVAIEEAARR